MPIKPHYLPTHNRLVAGSSPAGPTSNIKHLGQPHEGWPFAFGDRGTTGGRLEKVGAICAKPNDQPMTAINEVSAIDRTARDIVMR